MSTKIYTGFRVKHNNPALLQKQLKAMQIKYTEQAKRRVSAFLPSGSLCSPREHEEEMKKKIDYLYNEELMADVVIYFKKDKIIGTYFIHNRETEKWFRKQRWFADYHYQNQTDPDETVSTKEWNQRKRDWDFLNIPANDGFTFQLLNPNDIKPFWIACWRRDNLIEETNESKSVN